MACSGMFGNHEPGNSTVTSIHENHARKYSEMTSHISIVTWAKVPMKIKRMASANNTTVSFKDAHGRNANEITSSAMRAKDTSGESDGR